MTQEEKRLLLVDLCARLPYETIVRNYATDEDDVLTYTLLDDFEIVGLERIKPYLRPMSNMTEDEKLEIKSYLCSIEGQLIGDNGRHIWYFDYLKEHHFDFRKLIEKGLALEAPKDMYQK